MMKFEYTGRHIEVTPALQSHVEGQFEKMRHLFEGYEALAHVIIEVIRGRHRSEIIIRWRDKVFTANTSDADMYLSLSKTVEKIEKQILRLKTKVTDKHHKRTKLGEVTEEELALEEGRAPRIRNVRNYPVKPMTAEEAVLHLEDDSNQFLVFRDSENERISVIYRRSDGDFGLIQP
jgi:putative sigma-54 modulation protein